MESEIEHITLTKADHFKMNEFSNDSSLPALAAYPDTAGRAAGSDTLLLCQQQRSRSQPIH